jgi:hypothetical protein
MPGFAEKVAGRIILELAWLRGLGVAESTSPSGLSFNPEIVDPGT